MVIRLALALAGLLLPAALFGSTPPEPGADKDRAFLTGQLLIAAPAMGDPRFRETVLVMVRHDRQGAMGLVINRPAGEQPMANVLRALGEKDADASGTVRLFWGGPVQLERGFVLHTADYRDAGTFAIDGRLAMSASREAFRAVAAGAGPKQSLVAFGYAGWGPGQLEGEMKADAWYTAPVDLKLVFDEDRGKVWELAVQRRTRDL